MRKIVVNNCFGGYSLSYVALMWLYERGAPGITTPIDEYYPSTERSGTAAWMTKAGALEAWRNRDASTREMFQTMFTPDEKFVLLSHPDEDKLPRDHPLLVECVETLGKAADGSCARLGITEIPDDVKWHIEEYDGSEHVAEDHRTW